MRKYYKEDEIVIIPKGDRGNTHNRTGETYKVPGRFHVEVLGYAGGNTWWVHDGSGVCRLPTTSLNRYKREANK